MAPEECISALGGWEGYELSVRVAPGAPWRGELVRAEVAAESSPADILQRLLARSAGSARYGVAHRAGSADV